MLDGTCFLRLQGLESRYFKKGLFYGTSCERNVPYAGCRMVRRRFLSSFASLAASLLFSDVPLFLASRASVKEQGFMIVNGWVLTCEDVKTTIDVV